MSDWSIGDHPGISSIRPRGRASSGSHPAPKLKLDLNTPGLRREHQGTAGLVLLCLTLACNSKLQHEDSVLL